MYGADEWAPMISAPGRIWYQILSIIKHYTQSNRPVAARVRQFFNIFLASNVRAHRHSSHYCNDGVYRDKFARYLCDTQRDTIRLSFIRPCRFPGVACRILSISLLVNNYRKYIIQSGRVGPMIREHYRICISVIELSKFS